MGLAGVSPSRRSLGFGRGFLLGSGRRRNFGRFGAAFGFFVGIFDHLITQTIIDLLRRTNQE
jgi:hypothetical protein